MRMKMKRFDMMDLELSAPVAANYAPGFAEPMLSCHPLPLRAAFMSMFSGNVGSGISLPSQRDSLHEPPLSRMVCLPCGAQERDKCDEYHYHCQDHEQRVHRYRQRKAHSPSF